MNSFTVWKNNENIIIKIHIKDKFHYIHWKLLKNSVCVVITKYIKQIYSLLFWNLSAFLLEFRRNTCDTSVMAHPMECPSSHYPEPYLRRPPPSLHLARLLNRCWLYDAGLRDLKRLLFRGETFVPYQQFQFHGWVLGKHKMMYLGRN